jgi:CD2 antigen cytoplasmic tail-binding protein 2
VRGVEKIEAGHAPDENDEETAFEPFNLEREKREGYFDDDGNYVRNESDADDEKDAWLDDVHADARLSTAGDKLAVRKDSVNEAEETTDVDVANIKRELCTYLEAGETVLDALKRLGGASAGRGNGGKSGGARRDATKSSTSSRKTESSMDAQSKIAFEKVTELSSALMSNGEYDVYDSRKETFERAAKVPEGYAFDEATKLYKCESSGLSYCPKTGGFTDGEGRWWWFDDSTQQFVAWT